MRAGVIAEVTGQLRHDRWKDKGSGKWTGKVFVAVDPGEGGRPGGWRRRRRRSSSGRWPLSDKPLTRQMRRG
jgi:hypothetical protein